MKKITGKFISLKAKLNNPVNYFIHIGKKVFFLINILEKK